MKIAWIALGICLLWAPTAKPQEEDPDLKGDMSWDFFGKALVDQNAKLWKILNEEAPVYGVIPEVRLLPSTTFLAVTIYTHDGSQFHYLHPNEITITNVSLEGGDKKLHDATVVLTELHTQALAWQRKGMLASREQMSVGWTPHDADLQKRLAKVITATSDDLWYSFSRPVGDPKPRNLCTLLFWSRGKKYIALAADSVNESGMTNNHVLKAYPLERFGERDVRDTLLEIQKDILAIRKEDGYEIIPDLLLVHSQPPVPHRRSSFI